MRTIVNYLSKTPVLVFADDLLPTSWDRMNNLTDDRRVGLQALWFEDTSKEVATGFTAPWLYTYMTYPS